MLVAHVCDIIHCTLQLDVKEAPEVPTEHPQWESVDDEEEPEGDGTDDSEFTTDEDIEEERELK